MWIKPPPSPSAHNHDYHQKGQTKCNQSIKIVAKQEQHWAELCSIQPPPRASVTKGLNHYTWQFQQAANPKAMDSGGQHQSVILRDCLEKCNQGPFFFFFLKRKKCLQTSQGLLMEGMLSDSLLVAQKEGAGVGGKLPPVTLCLRC